MMTDNGPPFNGEEFWHFTREFDFKHHTSSPHFHQSNGLIEAMVKNVKAAYKKMDGSPNAQVRALLQLHDTPIVKDLPSPAEILHGQPTQGALMPQHHRPINIQKICHRLLEIQQMQKEHFDQAHWAKDERVLKVKEQVRFFPQKQFGAKLKWLTGTVVEILGRGHSYMIEGPNDPLIFEELLNQNPNKTSQPTPKTSPHSSHRVHTPRSPSSSPPAQFSPREHLVSPTPEDHTAPKQQKNHLTPRH